MGGGAGCEGAKGAGGDGGGAGGGGGGGGVERRGVGSEPQLTRMDLREKL